MKLSRTVLLVLAVVWLAPWGVRAQQPMKPKRVLVLYWDEETYPGNIEFERQFRPALQSLMGGAVEIYSEFLESSRFPGDDQANFLHDYILQKYASRPVDVVVASASAPLEFLLKYRKDLFPDTPIVFGATNDPSAAQLRSGAGGATGIIFVNSYRKTLDLALGLHPDTNQVFIVSGTPAHDKAYETMARSQLGGYESKAAVTYLTDLPLPELMGRIRDLPERSIVLYVWQQARDGQGKILESQEVLSLIAPTSRVPFYGMSFANVGLGIVGGYVWTMEANANRLAELTSQVAAGARASNIPVESARTTPMFDWRQLQRWNIREDRLPENSVIRFREFSLWQQFKWRIIAVIAMIVLQSLLIGALLLEHRRSRKSAAALVKAQRVLLESEGRFRNMANTAPVKIVVMDANGLATFFNKRWLDFTGRTMEQELGQSWAEGVHPDDRDEYLAKLQASQEARLQFSLECRLRRADGQYRSVLCLGVPRFEPDGTFAGYVESVADVTDLKQALANQKLESLGVLAGGIAHDFNNLLGSILASLELLLSDLADTSPARQGLENIKVISIRASEIVRQLMVYAGEESTVFEKVDLAELVREMLRLMMLTISKNAVLKIDIPADVPPIHGNPAQLRQVIMNLITNASDALREKRGEISVALTPQKASSKGISREFLRLEVRDSGRGMPEEIQARIFDPFFSTKRAGRGVGLAAVRGIVLSHGGTIGVQTAVGVGSCFEVLFPCVVQAEQESRDTVKPALLTRSDDVTATILFIDDEDALRLSITSMLRRKGYSVLETGDGATGMDMFQARAAEIDIVLLDLTLPGMSGKEVLGRLRQLRPGIKVVLSTAYGRDRAFRDLAETASVSYLRKPYQMAELIALLREVFLSEPALGKPAE